MPGLACVVPPRETGPAAGSIDFSAIEMDGYRSLEAGDPVDFDYEAAQQDSLRFIATRVRKL
jgi:CspA family cold shock protein